jgi:hypothetical protein
MAKSPSISLDHSGGRVRLRGLRWPLPVTLDTESKGRIKATIRPNVWTAVPEEIYVFLKGKFDNPRYTNIPDVEANEDSPHKAGESPIMCQEEVDRDFFMEFKN